MLLGTANQIKETKKKLQVERKPASELELERCRQIGCEACQLFKDPDLKHPKLDASGYEHPDIYFLGAKPGRTEDQKGVHFHMDSRPGSRLRGTVPPDIKARYNNIINCKIPGKDDLHDSYVEACRSRIEDDILKSKPKLVIALGPDALAWFNKRFKFIDDWAGRMFAHRIVDGADTHTFWVMPLFHPTHVLDNRRKEQRSEYDVVFDVHLKRAYSTVHHLPNPRFSLITNNQDSGIIKILDENKELLTQWVDYFCSCPVTGTDIETHDVVTKLGTFRPFDGTGVMNMTAISDGQHTISFPLDHPEASEGWKEFAMSEYKRYLMSQGRKVVHNFSMEFTWWLHFFGRDIFWHPSHTKAVHERFGDTYLAALTDRVVAGKKGEHLSLNSLDGLVKLHFGFDFKNFSAVDASRILSYPLSQTLGYVGMDAKWTAKVHQKFEAIINAQNLWQSYHRMIRNGIGCGWLEFCGMPANQQTAIRLRDTNTIELKKAEDALFNHPKVQQLCRESGKKFNPDSPEQVLPLLENLCGYKLSLDKNGKRSAGKEVLQEQIDLKKDTEGLAQLILDYRQLIKLDSNFLRPAATRESIYKDNKLHPKFAPITSTQRYASWDPNAQNFPKRRHQWVRSYIEAPPGYILVSMDEGQIEARAVSVQAKDKKFINLLWEDLDIHMELAKNFVKVIAPEWRQRIINILQREAEQKGESFDPSTASGEAKIMKEMRKLYKNGTFAIIYEASAYRIKTMFNISMEQAREVIDYQWGYLPEVKEWQKGVIKEYNNTGQIRSPSTGAVFKGVLSLNAQVNYSVQNIGAVLTGEAVAIAASKGILTIAQIHDDITFLVYAPEIRAEIERISAMPKKERPKFINALKQHKGLKDIKTVAEAMTVGVQELYPDFKVIPLDVEVEVGIHFGEMFAFNTNVLFDKSGESAVISSRDFGHVRPKGV